MDYYFFNNLKLFLTLFHTKEILCSVLIDILVTCLEKFEISKQIKGIYRYVYFLNDLGR